MITVRSESIFLFWFSTAVSTCDNKYFKNLDEELIETCNIMVYSSNTPLEGHLIDSIVFKPVKIVSKNSIDSMSNEKKMLVDMASKISDSGLFILKTKTKNNKDLPENEVIYASDWKSVTQFKNQPDVTNCVYYLANPTTKLVYIGEAQQLLNRVEVRKINGQECLVHKNQKDLDQYQFTEYRIDQITPYASARMVHSSQDSIIGSADALASKFPNGYTLTNSAYNKAHNLRRGK